MSSRWLAWKTPRADAAFQGIDFLELDLQPDEEHPTEATLVLHLQRPWSAPAEFTLDSVEIRGGRRVTNLPWTFVSQDGVARTVTLHTEVVGDPTDYTVTLRDGAGAPVHPFFATRAFTFGVHCDRGDCRPPAEEAPRRRHPRPAVDLLTRDYNGFVALLSEWVRLHDPHWVDLSPASLERALVELLAHQGDMLAYYQDRVASEAFLDTASQRYSLRQHATLLGTTLLDGTAAETTLALTTAGPAVDLPTDTTVTTPEGAGDAAVVFRLVERTRVRPDHGALTVAAWPGATDAELPAGATEVLLWGHVGGLVPGKRLCFVQGVFPGAVRAVQVVTITAARALDLPGWVERPTDAPVAPPATRALTELRFEPALDTAFSPWDAAAPFALHGNLATARHGLRVSRDHDPDNPDAKLELTAKLWRARRQDAIVEHRPGLARPILRAVRVPRAPVLSRAETDAAGVTRTVPEIDVWTGVGTRLPWTRAEHLHDARSYDRRYVAHADEDGSLWLEFGDGRHGMALELLADDEVATTAADELTLSYCVGEPISGNVGAGTLTRFGPGAPAGVSVVNVLPGVGGRQPEPRAVARVRVPASLRHGPLERAVALEDYARAAVIPGVARATAKALGGPFNTVLVLVDPDGQSDLSEPLRQRVYARVDALRMAGREHFVRAPNYVPLEVSLALCVTPGALPHRVRDAVLAALRPGSAERPGFFHPDRLSFGQTLELGELLAFVQSLPGVRSVKALRFRRLRVLETRDVLPEIPLGPADVVRLDADPTFPDNGTLAVKVVGVDADIDESQFEIEEVP